MSRDWEEADEWLEDADPKAWSVSLSFWRPLQLTDDEMEVFFHKYDGKWSEQTKAAIQRHKAVGLDLNQNWALIDRLWSCPVCKRQKADIFRVSSRGILLANLEEHHDHLRDFVNRRAREIWGTEWPRNAPIGTAHILDHLENVVSSFSHELVCWDCNSADGAIKAQSRGKIHDYFSFSPKEIAEFITVRTNAPHQIDFAKAEESWARLRPSFQARLDLIDNVLSLVQTGAISYDRGSPWYRVTQRKFEPQSQLYHAFLYATDKDERRQELLRVLNEFTARSVQKDSATLVPKTIKNAKSVQTPTQQEYDEYCDPVSSRTWREVSEDWACPVCGRNKREIVRKSKSGKWSGGVREHFQPVLEIDATALSARRRLLPGFRNTLVMRDSEVILICSGCQDVATQLKQRRRDIADQFLYVDDLRACLKEIAPHAPHDVDWDEAIKRVQANVAVGSAWDAYNRHVRMLSECREEYRYQTETLKVDHDKAVREVAGLVMFDARVDEVDEAIELAEWILTEATQRAAELESVRDNYRSRTTNSTD